MPDSLYTNIDRRIRSVKMVLSDRQGSCVGSAPHLFPIKYKIGTAIRLKRSEATSPAISEIANP